MSSPAVQHFFLLGSTPELSWLELSRTFPDICGLIRISNQLAGSRLLPPQISATKVLTLLGGVVKIAEVISNLPDDEELIVSEIVTYLKQGENRIHFALAEWGRDHLPKVEPQLIKERLTQEGKSVRYRTGSRTGLSAAILLHESDLQELIVISTNDGAYLAKTSAVQNIDQWQIEDRSKPFAQHKRGLLPPKVGRMMVAIGLGKTIFDTDNQKSTLALWDPFCGSGTILFEGLLLGLPIVYGSDIDTESIDGTEKNWQWFKRAFQNQLADQQQLVSFQSDATNVQNPPFDSSSISMIVTEPFLGKPTPDFRQIVNIQSGLERMYKGMFKEWKQWLKPGASVVCVFPKWQISGDYKQKTFDLHRLIDFLKPIGYTTASDPVVYARPGAVVQREIWHFTYQNQ